jgi:hypothetical protein
MAASHTEVADSLLEAESVVVDFTVVDFTEVGSMEADFTEVDSMEAAVTND